MSDLVRRIAALEGDSSSSAGLGRDFRVIEMHLARAEEKVLKLARSSHSTRGNLGVFLTTDEA